MRPDGCPGADPGAPVEAGEGRDHRVLPDLDPDVDDRRQRVDDRHTRAHQPPVDPLLGQRTDLRQCHPIVDAERLVRIGQLKGHHRPLPGPQDRDHVGQVPLILSVVTADLGQRLQQHVTLEGEDPGVDLPDVQLTLGRVAGDLGLDHALDRPVGSTDDAPVPARVGEHRGDDGRGGTVAPVGLDERAEGVSLDQRHVAVEHDHGRCGIDVLRRRLEGIGGPPRPFLNRNLYPRPEQRLQAAIGGIDDHDLGGTSAPRGLHRPFDHRPPAQGMEQLRGRRAHSRALPSGEDDDDGGRGHGRSILSDRRAATKVMPPPASALHLPRRCRRSVGSSAATCARRCPRRRTCARRRRSSSPPGPPATEGKGDARPYVSQAEAPSSPCCPSSYRRRLRCARL